MNTETISVQPVEMFRLRIPEREVWTKDELTHLHERISDLIHPEPNSSRGLVERIISLVCGFYGVDRVELMRRNKLKHISWARQVCMYLIRTNTDWPLAQIALHFNREDHGTVTHSVNVVTSGVAQCSQRREELSRLTADVQRMKKP